MGKVEYINASVTSFSPRDYLWSDVTAFEVNPASKRFKSENGLVLSKDGKRLILYPPKGDCVIPESVEQISGGAFRGIDGDRDQKGDYSVKWIMIPKTVKKMAKNAFMFVPEYSVAYEIIYNTAFISLVPNPVYAGDLNDAAPKEKNKLVEGFLLAMHHGRPEVEPYKDSYVEHIRNNVKTYIRFTYGWNGGESVFLFFIQEKLIPKHWIAKVMKALEEENRPDLKAELLAYQQENFPQKGKNPMSLLDDDPELKRRLQMEKRKEAIKNQKGIEGIAFVATGEMKHFGEKRYLSYSDESKGYRDWSDLKAYIEARGGSLRSAVSSKTDYLICNDPDSDSEKMKKAKELGVTIIDEKTFLKMVEE